ncbi:transmembrane channel-like protein isoform X2 [Uranotaenia lowii]|nr:transmembrane channel-like protein isoform X2 [Uranotaenia lowii]XP_055598957.1 transmembrane channel-like protein isoform X2 [Uranotaenia lowii]XP_055598958.1 transmembrane channel-like protein isoform X2 [Uranotaenia lowii]
MHQTGLRRNSEVLEDEDYSSSLNAIIKRKASIRSKRSTKSFRRGSSPISQTMGTSAGDRRRSSVYTTSSGETAITLEDMKDESNQDKIFENIRLHKEVLQSVKLEPWSMRRKLKLIKQAKSYITRHEGVLQEHFTSRTAKSLLTQFNIFLATKWHQLLRELANLSTYLIPWESRIKEIESHFGSVVASYFTFLRWLFWVNVVISCLLVIFVMMPEEIYSETEKVKCDMRKTMSYNECKSAANFTTLWEFEGRLKYSSLFYGYYSTFSGATARGYNLPMAYFLTGLVVYIYSFVATLKKMARNSRMSKLSSKDDEYIFSWKLFTGWDYMIGHTETAQNRTASIILGFKEALLEEAEKKKDTRNWKIIMLRVLVNFIILGMLAISAFAVINVVKRSMVINEKDSWWTRNEITVVMSLITFFFPMIFEALGLLEYYHPRRQLRIQLARIMLLNLLNLYSLIFALFDKINHMTEELRNMKPTNQTIDDQCYSSCGNMSSIERKAYGDLDIPSALYLFQNSFSGKNNCYEVPVDCSTRQNINTTLLTTMIILNISTTFLPETELNNFRSSYFDSSTTEQAIHFMNSNRSLSTNFDNSLDSSTQDYDFNYGEEDAHYYLEQRMRNLPNDIFDDVPINKRDVIGLSLEQFNWTNFSTPNYNENSTSSVETSSYKIDETVYSTSSNQHTTPFKSYENYSESYYDEDPDHEEPTNNETEQSTNIENDITSERCFEIICEETTPISRPTQPSYTEGFTIAGSGEYQTAEQEVTTINSATFTTDKYAKRSKNNKFKNADLRTLCWETMFGQELVKLTVMDLLVTVISTLVLDFLRAIFVRYMNSCWCWDLEKIYPKYGDFKIAENILHLVNNQGMVWMGMFFSPGLAVLNIIKLIIIMYLRSWTVLTCNVPHEVVFRASRSNNFYFALLLTMLFLCVLPVSYAIVFLEPSWHCGPFSNSNRIYHLLTNATDKIVPAAVTKYIVSPAAIIPLLVLLILIIYYLISLTGSLREANQDLKTQLRKERTEERRKMFKMAKTQNCNQSENANGLSNSWHKVLDSTKLRIHSTTSENSENENTGYKHREFLQRMMKKALLKEQYNTNETQPSQILAENINESTKNDQPDLSNERPMDKVESKKSRHKKSSAILCNENDLAKKTTKFSVLRSKTETSEWVEKIPVITISKTSSEECVIDSDVDDPGENM